MGRRQEVMKAFKEAMDHTARVESCRKKGGFKYRGDIVTSVPSPFSQNYRNGDRRAVWESQVGTVLAQRDDYSGFEEHGEMLVYGDAFAWICKYARWQIAQLKSKHRLSEEEMPDWLFEEIELWLLKC